MSTSGMEFYYGDYTHTKGEVYPEKIEVIPRYSEDGVRWGSTYTWRIAGNFLGNNPELSVSDISTKIEELRTAYNVDYKSCGFRDNDDTLTKHVMDNDDQNNLSGNRVTYRSWDNRGPTEYANTRSFGMTIQSTWFTGASNLISWRESTTRIGNGGPIWGLRETWNGTPYRYTIANQSRVTHIQEGFITTMSGWALPPLPYWPAEEKGEQQMVRQFSPRHHGDPNFSKPTHYVTHYRYVFERLGTTPFNPNTNFTI